MSIEKVRAYFEHFGIADRIREFDVSSATVELAAVAVGVEGARIAKSMSFKLDVSLKRFDTVFPAAGSANSAIEMTCDELEKYSSNFVAWVDVCKEKAPAPQA